MRGQLQTISYLAMAATLGVPVLFSAFALISPAEAKRPASGSRCNSSWVNNESAMDCFIKGEEETRGGVKHPHYVACDQNGKLFCCVDDNAGNQDCESLDRGGKATETDWIKAVIAAHRAMLTGMGRYEDTPEKGKRPEASKVPGGTLDRKPSP